MDARNSKGISSPFKSTPDCPQETNKNVPRGLMYRELGHKQKLGAVSQEFQAIAEDKLVLKTHEELRCELPGPSRSTFLMVFSPDGTKVASTHGNHNVYVTDLTTGKNVNTLSGHPRTPWCIAFHPSSNQILASGCLGGQVRVWDLHGGSEMWMADGQTVIASLAFHPTDRMLVIATYNELHFWDWSQPEPFTKCFTNNEKEKVRYVAFDPLGHKLITGISNAPQVQSQWDQWDRVPSCNPMASSSSHTPQLRSLMAPDRERRITVCYRSLVEQYEQLVQRYFDLSRSRSISTMDRGTDPMDFETEQSASGNRSRDTSGPSTSNNNSGSGTPSNNSNRWRERNSNSASEEGTNNSNAPRSSPRILPSLFRNPWQRQERPVNRTDSATATSESEPGTGTNSNSGASPTTLGCQRHRSSEPRWLPPFHYINPRNRYVTERSSSNTPHIDSLRRRLSTSALLDSSVSHVTPSQNRDILIVREDNHLRNHANSSYEPHNDRQSNRDRPTSPIFLPSIPRRFFVSQSSAFQPRAPRSDHSSSETRNSGRTVLPRRSTQRISLNAAAAAAVAAAPERRTPDSDPPRSRSPLSTLSSSRSRSDMTDVGVRYGIQLLSRHIDNMQRLCRARLEILQLQQIRRMWEDLQHQIRSLHSAVRESSITLARLTESPSPGASHLFSSSPQTPSNEDVSQRPGSSRDTPEGNSDSNSGHIPSVRHLFELARISDSSPAGSRDASSQNLAEDNLSRVPEEEIFQPPDGGSRLEGEPSGNTENNSSEPGSSTGPTTNDETGNQQYSFSEYHIFPDHEF